MNLNISNLKFFMRMKRLLNFIFGGVNIVKTIYFNFRLLPFSEAIKLPIWLYGTVNISSCCGQILWLPNTKLHFGGWTIGITNCNINGLNIYPLPTIIAIKGTMILGAHGRIANGCRIFVDDGAILSIGDRFLLNADGKIGCYERIEFGNDVYMSWECQIFDTDFHFIRNDNGIIKKRNALVKLGNDVWVGHNTTIHKGASCGDGCIIGSHSLLNRNFLNVSRAMFVGCPVRIVKQGCSRIHDDREWLCQNFFDKNIEKDFCNEEDIII